MVDVVVLGSGTPSPDPGRAGSAVALVSDDEWVLVDCGRAATQRAIDAGLDLTSVVAVALTHHHSDHVSDLATLATARWVAGAMALTVVAPHGPAASYARLCLDAFDNQSFHGQARADAGPRPAIDLRPFDATDEVSSVHSPAGWQLSSVLVDHHPVEPAVGYLVARDGVRVVVSGDTAVCDGMRALADGGVDVLVHEALLSTRVRPSLLTWNAGAQAVGELATATRPGTLVLTHLLPTPTSAEEERLYVEEVRRGGFDGPTIVAHDGLRLPIGDV